MRKVISVFLIGLFGLMILPKSVLAKQYDNLITLPVDEAQEQEIQAMDTSFVLEETDGEVLGTVQNAIVEDVDMGPHFYFGEDITVDEDLVGDVYVAGGTVVVNGMIDGDLMVAGGTVTLNGDVSQDVRAAGGTLMVNGMIGENLSIAGGTILFSSESKVGNSIVAAGGEVSLDGEVLGRVFLGGGAAKLAGSYGSDVNAQADTIQVAPGVVIAGSLIAEAGIKVDVSEEAEVMGEKMVSITPVEGRKDLSDEKMKSVGGVLVKATLVEFFMKLAMAVVSGGLVIYFMPKLVEQVSKTVLDAPLANAGWGLVYLFITPIVILLAMISIVALPIAGIITLVYLLSFIVAKWAVAYAVGIKLAKNLKVKALENKYLGFAVGMLVINAVGFVPVLGWLVKTIVFFIGMGAIFSLIKLNVLSKSARK
ncbi:MAG: hypothetical protein OEX81_00515 [Candidatus Pacebacteria bacterium]|nr:hypothetical protein [Candidatus Paceibacterota bacterium]